MHASLPPTTHTLEMAQIAELNERLTDHVGPSAITAGAIGMSGAPLLRSRAARLDDAAVLLRLAWQGSPEFPDIYGHFGPGGRLQALLHTSALDQLARALRVRQRWGVGLPAVRPTTR